MDFNIVHSLYWYCQYFSSPSSNKSNVPKTSNFDCCLLLIIYHGLNSFFRYCVGPLQHHTCWRGKSFSDDKYIYSPLCNTVTLHTWHLVTATLSQLWRLCSLEWAKVGRVFWVDKKLSDSIYLDIFCDDRFGSAVWWQWEGEGGLDCGLLPWMMVSDERSPQCTVQTECCRGG